ncbi:LysR family transcriptional regulator [Merdibacter massiliensis]|uniref:LysR family transcriptional regulator n=1 Tax=Merdibacter massiliensis TaxID=1871030 RepID=UPI00096A34F9|nr:LysR family transcriptional regulator [Merdibacter massiliensis]
MNTVQLECFISVAEHLNFSHAAQDLNISQAAVSHQIRSLENELNVRLFKRTSKTVELTEEGILFLSDARYILKTAFDAKERLNQHTNYTSFDIGCHNSTELKLLPPILHHLCQIYPHLHPSIHFFPPLAASNMIDNKKIHVTFGFLGEEKSLGSICFKSLRNTRITCICAPQHPFSKYEFLTKKQLQGNFIACNPHHIPNKIFSIQSQVLSNTPANQQYFAPNVESALTLVKAQLGYTLYFDMEPLRDPDLCYIPVSDYTQTLPFGLFYHTDNDHPILKEFIHHCESIYKN